MRRHVFHGTHRSFTEAIRECGIPALPGEAVDAGAELPKTRGVRVRLTVEEARRDARAWTAHMLTTKMGKPEGMVIVALIDERRIHEDKLGVLRVTRLAPEEIELRGPLLFPEFGAVVTHGRRSATLSDARAAITSALDDFEVLTRSKVSKPFAVNPRRR